MLASRLVNISLTLACSVLGSSANVTGYVLLMTTDLMKAGSGSCGGEGVADLFYCECHHITNPVSYTV